MADIGYRIITLPKRKPESEHDGPSYHLAKKFQEFRLHSLRTSPEAFASTADSPRELDLQSTIQRLSNPKAVHYIAVEEEIFEAGVSSPEELKERLCQVGWLGLIVLLGPEEEANAGPPTAKADPFAQMTAQSRASSAATASAETIAAVGEPSLHFHLNGMFVTPTARNRGIGKALIQKALDSGFAEARKQGYQARFSIAVHKDNESAQVLYEKIGFRYAGEETYTQERRTAEGATVVFERVALHMEMIYV